MSQSLLVSGYRPPTGSVPTEPGVYRFRDSDGRVIYVGKAKNLRARINTYFQDFTALPERTQRMVSSARSVDWVVVSTETEALQLEYTWIKEYRPRFNVRYRDDKSYPYLVVTMSEEVPRIMISRGAKRRGNRYFGPFSHAWAIRQTVDLLLKVFPVRTCRAGVYRQHQLLGRPCLLGQIERCSAPCVGRVSLAAHKQLANEFCDFMAGNAKGLVATLTHEMQRASAAENFEAAAKARDSLAAVQSALEQSSVVLDDGTNADVVGLASDDLEALVEVFHVREGRIRGERRFTLERLEELSESDLMSRALVSIYDEAQATDIPGLILVACEPADSGLMYEWLTQKRGNPVSLKEPKSGPKAELLATVVKNAEQALFVHKMKRTSDLTSRAQALNELADALRLPNPPLRIETIDISNSGGDDIVASMVVFEDGLPKKSDYRRFIIKSVIGQDDFASVAEVCRRRFSSSKADEQKRFAYPPQLVVIDGGLGQVNAAREAMDSVGAADIPVIGLAKRLEEVYLPGTSTPIALPRSSPGLYLLQQMRDEAHRFANAHLQSRRKKKLLESELDAVPGLGKVKKSELLRHFGSLSKIRQADVAQLGEVTGIGPALATSIFNYFHPLSTSDKSA